MSPADSRASRLLFLDWLRGVAVLTMILWHSMDAWTAPWDRGGNAFAVIAFLGGWAAPLFVFLAGVSVALAGEASLRSSAERRAPSAVERTAIGWRLQKRGWEIFLIAHLFRLQSFLLNPLASWSSLLKVDILNILGLGLVAVAFCWSRATTRLRQILWLFAPAAVIVLVTPATRLASWPALIRPYAPRLEAYIRPVAGIGVFSLFPWIAFIFIGALIGVWIASARDQAKDGRFQSRLALVGGAIVVAGLIGMSLPAITPSSFWTTSLSWFLIRTGAMTLGIPVAWLWMRRPGFGNERTRIRPNVVFGQESLFVYWVHVELAYGFFTHPIQNALPLPWAFAGFLGLTALMLWLTVLWKQRRRPLVPEYLKLQVQT